LSYAQVVHRHTLAIRHKADEQIFFYVECGMEYIFLLPDSRLFKNNE